MARIGEILSRSAGLSSHDLEEILQEQKCTRQTFGEAALALGKARPEQVWNAWLTQVSGALLEGTRLKSDAQAVVALPAAIAVKYGLVPLRVRGGVLVAAAAASLSDAAVRQIEGDCNVRLVLAQTTATAAETALSRLYPASVDSARA